MKKNTHCSFFIIHQAKKKKQEVTIALKYVSTGIFYFLNINDMLLQGSVTTAPPPPTDVTRAGSSWLGRHDWQTTTVQNKPGHNLHRRRLVSGGSKTTRGTTTKGRCRTRKRQQKRPIYVGTKRSTMKCLLLLLSCCSCSLISLGGKTQVSTEVACNEKLLLTTQRLK